MRWVIGEDASPRTVESNGFVFHLDRLLPPDEASFHSCDLWYVLGSLGNSSRPFEEKDYAISNDMVDRFAEFARTCSPNLEGAPNWHPYKTPKDIKIWE